MNLLFAAISIVFFSLVAADAPSAVGHWVQPSMLSLLSSSPLDLEAREEELNSLLQARLQTFEGNRKVGGVQQEVANVHFLMGKPAEAKGKPAAEKAGKPAEEKAQALAAQDFISPAYWKKASRVLNQAGWSTPTPDAAYINMPAAPPTPMPWQAVMQDGKQPLNTKLGGAIMYGLSAKNTPTPPPKQAAISSQFVAQCPMVLFAQNLSIRAPSCGEKLGRWIDTSPLNVRSVVRWHPLEPGGLFFGVDSSLSGPGSVLFADVTQMLTFNGYKFSMKNCLGVDRWHVEENVYKVDSMGQVSSTMQLHDSSQNSEAHFIKYIIKSADGAIAAVSTLFRSPEAREVNFTQFVHGMDTGKILAVATREGQWKQKGWRECMSNTSTRAWHLHFPDLDMKAQEGFSTVLDVRVAIAGAITLMASRDETRGADGLNTNGSLQMELVFIAGVALIFGLTILCMNFFMVFKASGLRDKLRRILFDFEAGLPKNFHQQRSPVLHPAY